MVRDAFFPFRPFGVSILPRYVCAYRKEADPRDVAQTDCKDFTWPHPLEYGHTKDKSIAQTENRECKTNLFRGYHPLFTFRFALRNEEFAGGIMINNTVGLCQLEDAAQVPAQVLYHAWWESWHFALQEGLKLRSLEQQPSDSRRIRNKGGVV